MICVSPNAFHKWKWFLFSPGSPKDTSNINCYWIYMDYVLLYLALHVSRSLVSFSSVVRQYVWRVAWPSTIQSGFQSAYCRSKSAEKRPKFPINCATGIQNGAQALRKIDCLPNLQPYLVPVIHSWLLAIYIHDVWQSWMHLQYCLAPRANNHETTTREWIAVYGLERL